MALPELDLTAAHSASHEDWRRQAELALKGAPLEKLTSPTWAGFKIAPLHLRKPDGARDAAGLPGALPFTRGTKPPAAATPIDLRQLYAHPDPVQANRELRDDLMNGVTSAILKGDRRLREGDAGAPPGEDGLMLRTKNDLAAALDGVDLVAARIAFEAGAGTRALAGAFFDIAKAHGRTGEIAACLGHDAFAMAANGRIKGSLEEALKEGAALAKSVAEKLPSARAITLSARPYHDAGAGEAAEIAALLSGGVAYLRALTNAGLALPEAARQIAFTLIADQDFYLSIVKFRAFRRTFGRVLEAAGDAGAMRHVHIGAETSSRMLTIRDPQVNILRLGAAAFAAILGGADALTVLPYTARHGLPGEPERRIARNTALILIEESHAARVMDAPGGAFAFEQLTDDLANAAWALFQSYEARGGLGAMIASGVLKAEIGAEWAGRRKAIARRKEALTGVSEFANLTERAPQPPAADIAAIMASVNARSRGASDFLDALSDAPWADYPALPIVHFDEDFERLRAAALAHAARNGKPPQIDLIAIGSEADYSPRLNFAKSLFAAGGIETFAIAGSSADDAAAAFLDRGTRAAILCSSDALYAARGAEYARAIKGAGARFLYLAGRAGDQEKDLREAGIDDFVFAGQDAIELLSRAHGILGVK